MTQAGPPSAVTEAIITALVKTDEWELSEDVAQMERQARRLEAVFSRNEQPIPAPRSARG